MLRVRRFYAGIVFENGCTRAYSNLSSVTQDSASGQKRKDMECNNALYEVYVNDPSQVISENDLITEVYYPVKKKAARG